ncbi:MAG: hypothetical protein HC893_00930 [Chloroflexaceae bacterium]|nr:hypothetical protein [Chloroflexaceae bacterium]
MISIAKRPKKALWQSNVNPNVIPGPLVISRTAYEKAEQLLLVSNPIAAEVQELAIIVAGSMGFSDSFSDFHPIGILTRWILAYNVQAEMNNYPPGLHFPVESGLADESRVEEYMMAAIKEKNTGETDAIARHVLGKVNELGPFQGEMRSLMAKTRYHQVVCKFVFNLCRMMKTQEFATERLVKEGKIRGAVSTV